MKLPLLACLGLTLLATMPAYAACPERIMVTGGNVSLAAIARTCGINVEALKSINPGMSGPIVNEGTVVRIPREAISLPSFEIGRTYGRTEGLEVPLAPGSSGSTVILPPPAPTVPPQHILRGFGDQPGQLPLPGGHSAPTYGTPPFPQFN